MKTCVADSIVCRVIIRRTKNTILYRPLGYERVYLPLCKVADTPFHIQEGGSDSGEIDC